MSSYLPSSGDPVRGKVLSRFERAALSYVLDSLLAEDDGIAGAA
jgi:hypothetical protein